MENIQVSFYLKNRMGKIADLIISFPRFEVKYEADLVEPMKGLGITDIFDSNKADFSKMTSSDIFINLLKQSSRIKVDEKGCEAAVSTIVSGMTGDPYAEKVEFNMNRPFAFLIKEESTGTILFMGKVTEL